MPLTFPVENNFTAGELSPRMYGRIDTEGYANGCKTIKNFFVYPQGGVIRRGGFKWFADARVSTGNVVLIPFVFTQALSQSYVLEFGYDEGGYLRIYRGDTLEMVLVEDIVTPYTNADIPNLRYAQSEDVMILVDGAHAPQQLTRLGPTHADWEWKEFPAVSPAWARVNKLTYKYYDILGLIASLGVMVRGKDQLNQCFNPQGSYVTAEGSGIHDATNAGWSDIVEGPIAWGDAPGAYNAVPKYIDQRKHFDFSWKVEGKLYVPESASYYIGANINDVGDVYINGELAVSQWNQAAAKIRNAGNEFSNHALVSMVKGENDLIVRLANGVTTAYTGIALAWRKDIGIIKSRVAAPTLEVTSHGWWNTVYQYKIEIQTDTSKFKAYWKYIAGFQDKTQIDYLLINEFNVPTAGTEVIIDATGPVGFKFLTVGTQQAGDTWEFQEGLQIIPESAFTQSEGTPSLTGYPRTVTFHQNRLVFGGSVYQPQKIWASKIYDIRDFTLGGEVDDALEFQVAANEVNMIQAMVSSDLLLVFTSGDELSVKFGIDNVIPEVKIMKSNCGAVFVDPVKVTNAILFTDRSGCRLQEYTYDLMTETYKADDITILSDHLFTMGISRLVYQKAGLVGASLVLPRPPINVVWALVNGQLQALTYEKNHKVRAWTQQPTLGTVESMCVLPGSNADVLFIAVKRDGERVLEVLDYDTYGDSIGNDNPDGVSYFESELETLPVDVPLGQGTSMGLLKRWVDVFVKVDSETNEFQITSAGDLSNVQTWNGTLVEPVTLRYTMMGWDRENRIKIVVPAPNDPLDARWATILGIWGKVKVNV